MPLDKENVKLFPKVLYAQLDAAIYDVPEEEREGWVPIMCSDLNEVEEGVVTAKYELVSVGEARRPDMKYDVQEQLVTPTKKK